MQPIRASRASQRGRRRRAGGRAHPEARPSAEPRSPERSDTPLLWPSPPGFTDSLAVAAVIVGPLILYALTMPRTVVLEDDGLFLVVGKFLGVGHPPGYPVHTLILNLFLKLPLGSTALLGHLLSAIFGALACGAAYACARLLGAGALPSLIGVWLFAASEHFWSQSIITEVYTLNALLFFSIFALLLYLRRSPADGRAWAAAAFLYGISLANQWPLMALASPGLLLAVVPMWQDLLRRRWRVTGAFVLGVIPPYAWMVWRSLQEPHLSVLGPLRGFDDFTAHLLRRAYSAVDNSPSAGWHDKLEYLLWFSGEFSWQLTLPGFLLALVGLALLLARSPWGQSGAVRVEDALDWVGRLAGPVVFLGQSVLIVWLRNVDFDFYGVQVFRPYSLICYGLLGIWLAVGLHHLMLWAQDSFPWPAFRRPRLVVVAAAASGLAMVGWSVLANWDANNRSDSDFAQRYADMVFAVLPPDAVLLAHHDPVLFPPAYYHFVQERRPDVLLMSLSILGFPDSLYLPTAPHTTSEKRVEAILEFAAETERPVFHTKFAYAEAQGNKVRQYGFLHEVLDAEDDGTYEIRTSRAGEEYFVGLFEREYSNGWELVKRNDRIFDYGQYLGSVFRSGDPELIERMAPMHELAERDYYGLIGIASSLSGSDNAERLEQAMELLEMAEPMNGAALDKSTEAVLYTIMGRVRWKQGREDEAIDLYEKSRDIWPHPNNQSVKQLEQINR